MKNLSIRTKITLIALLTVFVIQAVTTAVIAINIFGAAEKNTLELADKIVTASSTEIREQINLRFAVVQTYGSTVGAFLSGRNQPDTRDRLHAAMKRILEERPDLFSLFEGLDKNAVAAPGIIVSTGEGAPSAGEESKTSGFFWPWYHWEAGRVILTPVDYEPNEDYYTIPTRTGRDAVIEPYLYPLDGKEVLLSTLATPVRVDGRIIGMVSTDFILDDLRAMLDKHRPLGEGRIELIAPNLHYAATHKEGKSGQPADDLPQSIVEAIKSGQERVDLDSESGLVHMVKPVYFGNSETPWFLHSVFPRDLILGDAISMVGRVLWISLAGLILLSVILYLTIRRLLSPLDRLGRSMDAMSQALAQGEADLTDRLPTDESAEIQNIARSFNTYIEHVQRLVRTVKEQSDAVAQVSQTLLSGTAQIFENSQRQLESAQSTAAAAEEISCSVGNVAESSKAVGAKATENFSLTSSASTEVDQTTNGIIAIEGTVEMVRKQTQTLSDHSQEIASIVNVIREIADQTNLLALNAAIEAARAGETGRGFAVVADEVKKLAERTSLATTEINEKVLSVTGQNEAIVGEVRTVVELTNKGSEMAQNVNSSIGLVEENMREMTESIQGIVSAMDEQSKASQDISAHIESIRQMSQTTHDLLLTMQTSAEGLAEQAGHLKSQIAGFKV